MKILTPLMALFFIGCSHTTSSIKNIDEKDMPLRTIHWNEKTSQKIVADITSQILKSSKFSSEKFYTFKHIRNDTLEHPDTEILADNIEAILKKNGHLNFIEYDEKNPKHKIDGYCSGSLYADMQHDSNQRVMDFILLLKCTDTQTSLPFWTGQTKKSNLLEKGW